MYDVIQCEHTMRANRHAPYWVQSFLCSRGFCYLIMVGAVLYLLNGCTAKATNTALIPTTQVQSAPTLALTNDPSTITVQPQLAASPLPQTSTGAVTGSISVSPSMDAASAIPSETIITYTVKPGDNLTKIARLYGTTVEEIKALNGLTSDKIQWGTHLKVRDNRAPRPVPSITATSAATATLTAMAQPTATDIPLNQPTAESESGAEFQAVLELIDDNRQLVLFVSLPATFLVAVLALLAFRRGSTARGPSTQPPSALAAASTSGGLTGPPAVGTAYLETKLDATGTTVFYPLGQTITSIGRDPSNSIVIDHRFAGLDAVSRQHVQIVRTGDVFIAKDLGSANGIWINRRRSRENVLRDCAILDIGKIQFIFRRNQPGRTA